MAYADVLSALADPTRRHILEVLRNHPMSVGEIADQQPVSRPAVSQHLKALESARLVSVEPKGNRRVYAVRREGLDELRWYLEAFWSDVLSAYSARISRKEDEKGV